jgi:hypothetical protein
MSYCRWSSADFKSDFYVYAHVDGSWTIHMARNRVVGDCPPILWPADPKDAGQVEAWAASHKAQSAFLAAAEHAQIGLPHDGETFKLTTPGECADKCAELAALGYMLPNGVIEALREEQAEMDGESPPTPED